MVYFQPVVVIHLIDDQIVDAASAGLEYNYNHRLFSWTKEVSTWTTGNKTRQDVEKWLVFFRDDLTIKFNIHVAHQSRYERKSKSFIIEK